MPRCTVYVEFVSFHLVYMLLFLFFATQHRISIKKNIDSTDADFEFDFYLHYFFLFCCQLIVPAKFSHIFFSIYLMSGIRSVRYQNEMIYFWDKVDIEWLQNNNNNNNVLIRNLKAYSIELSVWSHHTLYCIDWWTILSTSNEWNTVWSRLFIKQNWSINPLDVRRWNDRIQNEIESISNSEQNVPRQEIMAFKTKNVLVSSYSPFIFQSKMKWNRWYSYSIFWNSQNS